MGSLPILYVPDISDRDALPLPREEAHHLLKVLRAKEGDEVRLIDGKGGIYKALVTEADKKNCKVRVEDEEHGFGERAYHLTMAVAPTKNDQRFEWFLEKATEMGVDRIVPLLSSRSEKDRIKRERFERILVAAMKQSNKAYLPELEDPVHLRPFLERERTEGTYIAHCYKEPEKSSLSSLYRKGDDATILIGPEGDFTREEVEMAVEKGCAPISLGKATLRTETAAVAACHTIALLNEG